MFPPSDPWNTDISSYPVHPSSASFMASINHGFQPDFASQTYGIPFVVVGAGQPLVPVTFNEYPSESDPGPYPIPANAPIESGNDHHVIVVDVDGRKAYELYHASVDAAGNWTAGCGAVFDFTRTNPQRPDGWTSCDQAGLCIFAGLVRYDEVASGAIHHALRMTVPNTQHATISPATHPGDAADPSYCPMGLRVRLKASTDLTPYGPHVRVILTALKKYGAIVADTSGGNFDVTGAPDPRWDDNELGAMTNLSDRDFEAVDTGPVVVR